MITLKHTEDMNLPRSVRSYIDSCATEFCYADESIKIAELAYRLKRGVDLLPVFIEDIKQHMEHPAYGEYEDIAKNSIAGYIDFLRTGDKCSMATTYLSDKMKFPALFQLLTEEILYRYWEHDIEYDMTECHFDEVHFDYNDIAARFKDSANAKREFFKYISTSEETFRNIEVDGESLRRKNGWKLLADKLYGYTVWSDKEEDQRIYPGDAPILHKFNGRNEPKYQFITGVPPMPFSGNLLRAKVVILTLNPGYVEKVNKDKCLEMKEAEKEQLLHLMRKALTLDGYGIYDHTACSRDQGDHYWEKAFAKLAMDAYDLPSNKEHHPIYEDIAFFQLIGYHSVKFKDSAEIKHLPSMVFTKLLIKYLVTRTDKTFLILRSEELWKETMGEDTWNMLETKGRIITKGHKGMSQHITRGNIKKDNGYDRLVNILKNSDRKIKACHNDIITDITTKVGGDTQKEAINGYKETLGTIKAIICKRPEERRTAIQKEILKQLEDGAVPSIAFCHETESQEWVSSLLKCTGMEMQNVDTDNVLTLSKMPLYLFCEKSFDIGWLSWKLYRNIEKLGIKKIYFDDITKLSIVDPNDEEYIKSTTQEMPESHLKAALDEFMTQFIKDHPEAAAFSPEEKEALARKCIRENHVCLSIEILRHIVDNYGIELTFALDNELWFINPNVRKYENLILGQYGAMSDYVDEVIVTE